jgi:hypothetical protein
MPIEYHCIFISYIHICSCFLFHISSTPSRIRTQLGAFESAIVAVQRRLDAEHTRWETLQKRMRALHDRILGTRARGAEVCSTGAGLRFEWFALSTKSRSEEPDIVLRGGLKDLFLLI